MPKVALFIPCYVDQLFPRVGLATVDVLERFGVKCEFPREQTCCGQPMANTGCNDAARPLAVKFVKVFTGFDHVVCPSGSCVAMVRQHYHDLLADSDENTRADYERLSPHVYELCEYLTKVLGVERIEGRFPHRVGLHQSCHGLRELRLAKASELNVAPFGKTRQLLESLDGIELTEPARPDECCGFGGTFAINEEAVSCLMGDDRIRDHEQAGTEVLTGNDMSCLMHLGGLLRRRKKPMRVMHVAEILAEAARLPAGANGSLCGSEWLMAHAADHPAQAASFVADDERVHWHDGALWFVRAKRDKASQSLAEWEQLRETAGQIKAHMIANLARYLEQFEAAAQKLGCQVHWARDAAEHNRIVHGILARRGVKRVVKSKSMLTEECHLNPFLESHGIEVVDTDLGERIVQLAGESPSHIVLPAIHKKKEDVSAIFVRCLGTEPGNSQPAYLAEAARGHLREKFLKADAGITGVNFAIAETGGLVVCTNEGNADLGVSLPKLHIACMGIEKLLPRARDLGVFLRLLARSATGQPITTYSSHFHGPAAGGELHIVLVDNGRSDVLASDEFRRSLHCIRCGACMNTCPVYRRSGGHSYGSTVPGPIGSILAPARDAVKHASLPFACSLCGSCTDVCPVKIDLHHQLLAWRGEIARRGILPASKRWSMKLGSLVLRHTWLYRLSGKLARLVVPRLPRFVLYGPWNPWGRQRELPEFPPKSFREEYEQRRAR